MNNKTKSYKRTEKWWLGLTILFYFLYNLPGVPEMGNANSALLHGALTIIPLWIISYAGLIIVNRQRKVRTQAGVPANRIQEKEETSC